MIILEGPDGSGKSTLAKQLEEQGYTIIKQGRGEAFKYSTLCRICVDNKMVFDRWGITSWVYRILNYEPLDECDFDFEELMQIFRHSTIVYCNNKHAFEFSIERGEDNVTTLERAAELQQLYNFAIATIKLYDLARVVEYDFENDSFEDLLKKL